MMMRKLQVMCHPDNVAAITERFPVALRAGDIEIIPHPWLERERTTGKVLFPEDRFVEYGSEDHQWALALGFATRDMELVYYEVNFDHPPNWPTEHGPQKPMVIRPPFLTNSTA